ncbi:MULTISPECIES: DUF397 domain-containing protein [unclassified Streptomyces]|uniref:DUF397 domain-containing protein n=1 Tax=unclassified Streptomyces TaxID=2593676 RepID=UPI00044C7F55|nr:DUF397 domain-containing protein [Streptomyces sp. PCS3-D2]WKV72488.1 DUF397 domain-containing protein [Streptomyces sp. PCS3-D2]
MIHEPEPEWFKSSYSDSGDINDCVEVATTPRAVLVRDSKDTLRAHLAFGHPAWEGFVAHASGL